MKRLEHRVVFATLVSIAPLLFVLAWLMFAEPRSSATRWSVGILAALSLATLIAVVRAQIDYPLRTLANLISALREGDYSIWARSTNRSDAMSEVTRVTSRPTGFRSKNEIDRRWRCAKISTRRSRMTR